MAKKTETKAELVEVVEVPIIKPGVKTSEFWMSLAAISATIISSVMGNLPPQWAAISAAVVAGLYAYSRGQAKKA